MHTLTPSSDGHSYLMMGTLFFVQNQNVLKMEQNPNRDRLPEPEPGIESAGQAEWIPSRYFLTNSSVLDLRLQQHFLFVNNPTIWISTATGGLSFSEWAPSAQPASPRTSQSEMYRVTQRTILDVPPRDVRIQRAGPLPFSRLLPSYREPDLALPRWMSTPATPSDTQTAETRIITPTRSTRPARPSPLKFLLAPTSSGRGV